MLRALLNWNVLTALCSLDTGLQALALCLDDEEESMRKGDREDHEAWRQVGFKQNTKFIKPD